MNGLDLLELYRRDLRIIDSRPVSREEEQDLFRRIGEGDKDAYWRIYCANTRFVINVAMDYKDTEMSLPELVSEGNNGLLEAIDRFDVSKGFKFITYAVWWIRQAILKALYEQTNVRVPVSRIGDIQKINSGKASSLEQSLGRVPTTTEIGEHLGLSEGRVERARKFTGEISLDAPPSDYDEDSSLYNLLKDDSFENPEDALQRSERDMKVDEVLSQLDERKREIFILYFGLRDCLPMTLEEIGKEYGITRERVRQIRDKALEQIRKRMESDAIALEKVSVED